MVFAKLQGFKLMLKLRLIKAAVLLMTFCCFSAPFFLIAPLPDHRRAQRNFRRNAGFAARTRRFANCANIFRSRPPVHLGSRRQTGRTALLYSIPGHSGKFLISTLIEVTMSEDSEDIIKRLTDDVPEGKGHFSFRSGRRVQPASRQFYSIGIEKY